MVKVERKVFSSVRLIQGSPHVVETDYENLTNLVLSYGGRVHGSQHNFLESKDVGVLDSIAVYFEIPTDGVTDFTMEESQIKKMEAMK